jgi:hypothetical protein
MIGHDAHTTSIRPHRNLEAATEWLNAAHEAAGDRLVWIAIVSDGAMPSTFSVSEMVDAEVWMDAFLHQVSGERTGVVTTIGDPSAGPVTTVIILRDELDAGVDGVDPV